MAATLLTYLALGDSYTVGEGVETGDSFPFQLVRRLNKVLYPNLFENPVIIAKTGWTSSELFEAIEETGLKSNFDIVTMLIGVNNQYRGLSLDEYELEFSQLATLALAFARNNPSRVFVLSIPDWSATPFAANLDREAISFSIDRFNELNRQISITQGFTYIDITKSSREALNDPSLVTTDRLHPSGLNIGNGQISSFRLFRSRS